MLPARHAEPSVLTGMTSTVGLPRADRRPAALDFPQVTQPHGQFATTSGGQAVQQRPARRRLALPPGAS
jgi:hypothetical protein